LLLGGTAFALRLLVMCLASDPSASGDSPRYIELADGLLKSGQFARDSGEQPDTIHYPPYQLRVRNGEEQPHVPGQLRPEVMRTPGYPAFLALVGLLCLPAPAAILLQCGLAAGTVIMTYYLCLRLLASNRLAVLAAAMVMIHPADILSANQFLSETLFTFLWFAAIVCVVAGKTRRHLWWYAIAGILVALGTLVRPVGALLGILLGAWIVGESRSRKGAMMAMVLIVSSAMPVAAWMTRNARVGRGFILSDLSTVQWGKLCGDMEMMQAGQTRYPEDFWPHYHAFFREVESQLDTTPSPRVRDAALRVAAGRIAAHPGPFLKVTLDSASKTLAAHSLGDMEALFGRTYRPMGLRDYLMGRGQIREPTSTVELVLVLAWVLLNLVLATMMIVGVFRLLLQRRFGLAFLLVASVAYFTLLPQSQGVERMRVPFLGIQAIAAAAAFLPRPRRGTSSGSSPSGQLSRQDQTASV
jgi:hypothetical protein